MPPVFGVTGAIGAQVIGLGCDLLVTPQDGVSAAACTANAIPDPTLRTRASPAAARLRAGATDAIYTPPITCGPGSGGPFRHFRRVNERTPHFRSHPVFAPPPQMGRGGCSA